MTKGELKEKATTITKKAWNMVRVGFTKVVKGLSSLAGEALSACETKKAAADIQAQGALYNLQRQATREMPIIPLNSRQEEALLFPEYRGQGAYIQLDPEQSERVFQHMLVQHCLNENSCKELVENLKPLTGLPILVSPIYNIHKMVADIVILSILNEIRIEEGLYPVKYEKILRWPMYNGDNSVVCLHYFVSSYAEEIEKRYKSSKKRVEEDCQTLKESGVSIDKIVVRNSDLNVYLKWT